MPIIALLIAKKNFRKSVRRDPLLLRSPNPDFPTPSPTQDEKLPTRKNTRKEEIEARLRQMGFII